jgi:hypothetical protein
VGKFLRLCHKKFIQQKTLLKRGISPIDDCMRDDEKNFEQNKFLLFLTIK